MPLVMKHKHSSYKRYLWEQYKTSANITVSKKGVVTRINVSGPVAIEKTIVKELC